MIFTKIFDVLPVLLEDRYSLRLRELSSNQVIDLWIALSTPLTLRTVSQELLVLQVADLTFEDLEV